MNIRKSVAIAAAGAVAVVGLGASGAVADRMIGSKQLKQNAVKSKHIKNGTIKGKDLAKGLRKKVNAPGEQGPAGPAGSLDVISDALAEPTIIEKMGGSIKERFTDLDTEVTLEAGTYLISVDGSFINDEALPESAIAYPQVSVWVDKNEDGKFDWSDDPELNEGSISPNAIMPAAADRHIQFSGSTILVLDGPETVKIVGFGYDSETGTVGAGKIKVNDALLTAAKIG